ncbi:hypothetical protein A2Y85_05655 [candidate division WOR-3 bacterium RBG_13_43_14]|uniref:Peptidyl-prolyl cis-trans isomerase n=1 Tax=candidate division WOR-3 bacterium RBG_13_43_14 TaxID=1802590 RepID=A0A1F4UF94_UNCW3|nr:MAG: hypothetical protein A2Y85_05655 [candidate division WOR-3 bacterium RBG_13_43_14]
MKYFTLLMILVLLTCSTNKKEPTPIIPGKETGTFMHIDVENYGKIVIKLHKTEAPKNVENIITLTNKGFYNGLTFHRIIKGFMIQGGCPIGDGTGTPGYELPDEISANLKHLKGTMAMANRGSNTNGCQFYICLEPQPRLDGSYTIIGQVTEGMDAVERIGEVATSGSPMDRPLNKLTMTKVWIEER